MIAFSSFDLCMVDTNAPLGYWTAANKVGSGDKGIVWFSTGEALNYKKFHEGQPENANRNEGAIEINWNEGVGWGWSDYTGSSKLGYVCQTAYCG